MNHFWKIIIVLLTSGLAITGCKKDEKASTKPEFTDAEIETLYKEMEPLADAMLMSDTPDWNALVEKYKDRKEIAAIEANSDGMMVEFVNERVNGWLIPPPPSEIKWDMEEWMNMGKSIQQRNISEKTPKMLYVNAWYYEKAREENFKHMNVLCSAFKNGLHWDVTIVDEDANVDFFGKGLKGYDVVLIYAHGSIWNNKTWILTSQEVTDPDQYSKSKLWGIIKIPNPDIEAIEEKGFWAVSHSYISDSYSENSFENSMIYMACCHGLEKPTHLGYAFVNKGKAKVVVGWDETNCIGPTSGFSLLSTMVEHNCSLKDGIKQIVDWTYDNHPTHVVSHLVYYGRTGNDIGLNKGGDYKLPTPTPDGDGVVINGVRWATCNVDKPGTFAAKPEDAGMFYQWNRKVGWSTTNPMINSNGGTTWDSSEPTGNTWEKANDPSPAGWRVPTKEELESLANTTYVTWAWTNINGINGYRCTDKATGNSLFLPAAGFRDDSNGSLFSASASGGYWSSTEDDSSYGSYAYYLYFSSGYFDVGNGGRACGFSVRCVAE